MAHTITTRPRARADLREAVLWLTANRTPALAGRWLARYDATVKTLEAAPHSRPEADEANELGCELRQAVFRFGRAAYRILFTITGDTVNVIRVRHAAQDRLTDADI